MTRLKGKKYEIEGKQYCFVEHIKDGGNASVWRVKNDNKEYAIKILNEKDEKKKRDLKMK